MVRMPMTTIVALLLAGRLETPFHDLTMIGGHSGKSYKRCSDQPRENRAEPDHPAAGIGNSPVIGKLLAG